MARDKLLGLIPNFPLKTTGDLNWTVLTKEFKTTLRFDVTYIEFKNGITLFVDPVSVENFRFYRSISLQNRLVWNGSLWIYQMEHFKSFDLLCFYPGDVPRTYLTICWIQVQYSGTLGSGDLTDVNELFDDDENVSR